MSEVAPLLTRAAFMIVAVGSDPLRVWRRTLHIKRQEMVRRSAAVTVTHPTLNSPRR